MRVAQPNNMKEIAANSELYCHCKLFLYTECNDGGDVVLGTHQLKYIRIDKTFAVM